MPANATEVIHGKADHTAPYAGLLTWKNAPHGRILASDVTIAKNYLSEPEIKRLERTISGFFDYIENIIENRVQMNMADMAASVDKFLSFNEYEVLTHKGNISKTQAEHRTFASPESTLPPGSIAGISKSRARVPESRR